MRKSFWIVPLLFLLFAVIDVSAARADSISYSYTGAGVFAGTQFTYISLSGYLSAAEYATPTTATDLYLNGVDFAPIAQIVFFVDPTSARLYFCAPPLNPNQGSACYGGPFFSSLPSVPGTFLSVDNVSVANGVDGTLVVSDLSVATPEPGTFSLMLIAIGLLGAMLVMRKRIAPGLPQAS